MVEASSKIRTSFKARTNGRTALGEPRKKLSQRVAGQIMSEIRDRGWRVCDLLGTEAQLMARYGVSRATLGEAVRQVERQGAATMRPGVNGGLTITEPAAATISRSIATYLELSDVTLAEQFDAWRIIEVQAAGLAARKVSAADVEALRALVARIDEADERYEYLRRCMAVRLAIAERTENPALALFLRVLARVLTRTVPTPGEPNIDAGAQRIRLDLGEMVDAISDGDVALAQGIARMNLALRQESVEKRTAERGPGAPVARAPSLNPEKLAEAVAWRIRDDIAQMGWPQDVKLGEESELLKRYGVSRWVLRQALGTLEVHAMVRSRRGPGGGLLIGRPDPTHTIEATAGYLYHADFKLQDLYDLRAHLLENAVQLAAAHAPADPRALLASVADAENAACAREAREASVLFYREIARLSGNRVLGLFLTILTEFISTVENEATSAEVAPLVRRQRRAIADALISGNAGLARRLTTDHLDRMRPFYSAAYSRAT